MRVYMILDDRSSLGAIRSARLSTPSFDARTPSDSLTTFGVTIPSSPRTFGSRSGSSKRAGATERLAAMPDQETRWTRGERVGCGCLLIAVGSVVSVAGFLWWSADDFFGQVPSFELRALTFGGLVAVGWGVFLIFRQPPSRPHGEKTRIQPCLPIEEVRGAISRSYLRIEARELDAGGSN